MFEKNYLKEYIFTYERLCEILEEICKKYNEKVSKVCIGKTTFDYSINCFKIGMRKKTNSAYWSYSFKRNCYNIFFS